MAPLIDPGSASSWTSSRWRATSRHQRTANGPRCGCPPLNSRKTSEGKQEDFLFTDKEADPQIVKDWTGPTVYETGTTGLELVTRLRDASAQPTIWTAGVGSFVRTMAALVDPAFIEGIPKQGYQSVLDQLRKHQELAYFYDCNDERHDRYLAKVIGGAESQSYPDEEVYSTWLRDNWAALAPNIWDPLGADTYNPALKEPYKRIGRGLVTTIHEGTDGSVGTQGPTQTEHRGENRYRCR